jgi:mono/diheme cytochrome c family protein
MKRFLATSLVAILALTTACGEKKVEEKQETQGQAAKAGEPAKETGDASAEKPAKPAQKLIELYPPFIDAFPISAPDPGRSLYFGFVQGGTQKFEMIWLYAVAAVPDFRKALNVPTFASEAEFTAFMEKWAAEFKERPEMVEALTKKQNEFSFTVDPTYFTDVALAIPPAALEGQPNYVKITQKFYARRLTTKAAGTTSITATIEGQPFSVPVTIASYTAAQMTTGSTRYTSSATGPAGGCAGCHGNPAAAGGQNAYFKHSSDYLAYGTDAEIGTLIETATYPGGAKMANAATHMFTFATPEEKAAVVAYLRSLPTAFDKVTGVANQPAALRLRLR